LGGIEEPGNLFALQFPKATKASTQFQPRNEIPGINPMPILASQYQKIGSEGIVTLNLRA